MGFRILGTGSALPEKILTNDNLTEFLDTSDEWISTRTGIKERRIITGETLEKLAVSAAKSALSDGGVAAGDIDLIICATLQGEYITPSLSCLIAGGIGARPDCVTFDLNMACCGFVYALSVADAYFKSGMAKNVLIVSAEEMSKFTDWQDRSTCVLFGDGTAAAVLTADKSEVFFDVDLKPNAEFLRIDRAAGNCPYHGYAEKNTLKMDGQEVYKFASDAIHKRIEGVLKKAGVAKDAVDKFVLHQANIRIIESAIYKLKLEREKFPHNIDKFGNTSSVSVPLLLDGLKKSGAISRGEKIVLCAFGAGLASIACLMTF